MSANELTPLQRFHASNPTQNSLTKSDFSLENGTANERSKIAEFRAPYPVMFREGRPLRIALQYHEAFAHTGATTAEQSYNLALDVVDTPTTIPIAAYADGSRLTLVDSTPGNGEFTVDYSANSVTVEQNTDVTVHVFYVARDPLKLEIWKEQPGTVGEMGKMVYDDVTADLHVRDQNQGAPRFSFQTEYEAAVPEDWLVSIYTDGSAYGVDWDDSDTDTSGTKTVNNLTAVDAVIDLPVFQAQGSVPGLEREVVADIGNSLSPR